MSLLSSPPSLLPLTLEELCDATGETRRTVRFYILNGLLTPPVGAGPASRYPGEHVERLRFIRQMQDDGMQLSKIRAILESTPAHGLRHFLPTVPLAAAASPSPPPMLASPFEPMETSDAAETGFLRSPWERITLEPGVELHVRRPLGVAANRRVQRLLDFAQKLSRDSSYKSGR